jgi:Mg-chelatase subunit ChlD
MKTRCYVHLLVDRSGSMSANGMDTEATQGIRDFIAKQAELDGVKVTVSLSQFDTIYDTVYSQIKAAEVPDYTLVPRGMTALYEAVCKTARECEQLDRGDKPPDKKVFVVVTDGHENSSGPEFTYETVKATLDKLRTNGWEVVWLASEPDTVDVGRNLGVHSTHFDSRTKGGTRAVYDAGARSITDFFTTDATEVDMPEEVKPQDGHGSRK